MMRPKIYDLIKELSNLLPMSKDDQKRLDEKIRLEFNFNSNHIEGNTLTYGETKLLLMMGQVTGDHEKRELDEMEAHDVAFRMIKEWAMDKERVLTEVDVKTLNEVILVKPFYKEAITLDRQSTRRLIDVGTYKKFPNSVRLANGEIHEYASPEDTPRLMGELLNWYRKEEEKGERHPVELAALWHYRFVSIHPFDDGNGRVARLVMNYILLKSDLPALIIKSADKKNYLMALNKADVGDLEAFIEYITDQFEESLRLSISAAKGESIEDEDDWMKELKVLSKLGEKAPEKRNYEITRQRILDSIYPLIDGLLNITKTQILPLFEDLEFRLVFKIYDLSHQFRSRIFNVSQDRTERDGPPKFEVGFHLKNYKSNGINTFNLDIKSEFLFNDYSYEFYVISSDKRVLILRKPINKKIEESDIKKSVNSFGKLATERIKESIDSYEKD